MHGCLEVRRLCLLLALTALPGVVSAEANTYQERFAGLALAGPRLELLTLTISGDNLSAGLAGVAFIAYLSGLTNQAYTATQYALFSSLMSIVGKFISGWSGVVVEAWGYPMFFVYAACTGIPAIILVLLVMRHDSRQPAVPPVSPGGVEG